MKENGKYQKSYGSGNEPLVQSGDTILVKASHGMHFEKVVEKLQTL